MHRHAARSLKRLAGKADAAFGIATPVLIGLLCALCLLPATEIMAAETRDVLVLYSNNRLLPANVAADRGLRAALVGSSERSVQTFSEFLDRPYFGGEAYEATVASYLREKYSARPPDAIVAASDEAFDFIVRQRSRLFAGTPVVHMGVSKALIGSMPALPPDVVGIPIEYDFAGTIEQALRWHPESRKLLVITGASDSDRASEARLRREVPLIAGNVAVEFLAGLPTAAVLQRLGDLEAGSTVFTLGYFRDGAGRVFIPREAAALMAAATAAPVYSPFDSFIGVGVVGGRMPSFEDTGHQAGMIVARLLEGAPPASLRLPEIMPTRFQVDWRQMRRFGIDDAQMPADLIAHFKEPTFWEAYRSIVLTAAAIILVQAALIAVLLFERRRRRVAERAVQKQRSELAHASRLAVAGELTASIAHEINQPLGAILTNADTADLLLQSDSDRREDLRRIMIDIRRDDLRASDVIRRLRAMLAKQEVERRPLELNAAMSDVAALLRAEAERRHVTLDIRPAKAAASVFADPVQIQQVLINLLLNAMDAVADFPEERRTVVMSVGQTASGTAIVVRDSGHGIANEDEPRLFDSFFSTKQKGMGLGLSIARTIVEAHGGRIWAENGLGGGAVFYVQLPAHTGTGAAVPMPA